LLCSVAKHTENGEQPEGEPNAEFYAVEQNTQEKDQDIEHKVGE
jgi:hypothetical protein